MKITEPKLEPRDEQHYMEIRTQVLMRKLMAVIPQLLGENICLVEQAGQVPGWCALHSISRY